MTTQVHFTRHGFADLLEMSADNLWIEYRHMSGHLEILECYVEHVVVRNAWGEIKNEYDRDAYRTKFRGFTVTKGDNALNSMDEIEALILEHTGKRVTIERFIEAYYVAAGSHISYHYTASDVPMYKGVDVRGVTVAELLERGVLSWTSYADGSYNRYLEKISDLLDTSAVHSMQFIDFYTLVHDNGYKQDFCERIKDELCKAVLI